MNQNPPSHEDAPSWESRLEKLRQTRQINAPYTHAPLLQRSPEGGAAAGASAGQTNVRRLDDKSRDKILQEYLKKWQEEHNVGVAESGETVETDTMVLLQENWLAAQNALQTGVSDKHIDSRRSVWFNPKRRSVEFPEPEQEEKPSANQEEGGFADGMEAADLDVVEEKIPVNINVLNPQTVGRKEVFCLSEQELTERLVKRLRPHLTDAVNGIIRTTLQKQVALMTYQMQQTLSEQAPDLVEEVLTHNLQRVLNDLKYEMKYKR
ncbi:hypothetical protein [Neisseria animalis]|uniref:Uncharacterized protein n=1 Tax=Neisseria animalis TaxID=492 RepID=A0A5P3MRM5_NEIAN|nr:hypothetical protein [Neisseria animalis]QEY24263.1 hypothetical protein D0T90_06995 [Neisseria animalis]ROW32331.1 hypothetical protein CGZ60_05700 [Neisseria animalis]VEE06647.1 Uncharacterised protein [Neisseria animalis]